MVLGAQETEVSFLNIEDLSTKPSEQTLIAIQCMVKYRLITLVKTWLPVICGLLLLPSTPILDVD